MCATTVSGRVLKERSSPGGSRSPSRRIRFVSATSLRWSPGLLLAQNTEGPAKRYVGGNRDVWRQTQDPPWLVNALSQRPASGAKPAAIAPVRSRRLRSSTDRGN